MSQIAAAHEFRAAAPTQATASAGERAFDDSLFSAVLVAAGMLAGVAVPGLAAMLSPLLLPSLFVIILTSLFPLRKVIGTSLFSFDLSTLAAVAWLQFVLPGLVLAISAILTVPDEIVVFVLFTACCSTVFASPTIADMVGLSRLTASRIMVLSTLVAPISIAAFLGPFMGVFDLAALKVFAERVGIYLIIPLGIVTILAMVEGPRVARVYDLAERGSQRIGMMALAIFAVALMNGTPEKFAADPVLMLAMFAGVLLLNLGMALSSLFVFGMRLRRTARLIALVSTMRNVGLGMALVAAFFGPDLACYVALCQVPLMVLPMLFRLANGGRTEAQAAS